MNKKLTREVVEDIFYSIGSIVADCAQNRFLRELEQRGYLEEEPLTFEKIKKVYVSGETKLFNSKRSLDFIVVGFLNNKIVLSNGVNEFCHVYEEKTISNWKIKK